MKFVITAMDHLNRQTNDCFFTFDRKNKNVINYSGHLKADQKPIQQFFSLKESLYPYLIVNLRSGATFTRVESVNNYKRIAGSNIGSNVFVGILRLLNIFNDPTSAIHGALDGDDSDINLTVGDIYGSAGESSLGLPDDMIASSFAKCSTMNDVKKDAKPNDISRALLTMVSVNTLMLSSMIAKIEKIKNVIWIGNHIDIL